MFRSSRSFTKVFLYMCTSRVKPVWSRGDSNQTTAAEHPYGVSKYKELYTSLQILELQAQTHGAVCLYQ